MWAHGGGGVWISDAARRREFYAKISPLPPSPSHLPYHAIPRPGLLAAEAVFCLVCWLAAEKVPVPVFCLVVSTSWTCPAC